MDRRTMLQGMGAGALLAAMGGTKGMVRLRRIRCLSCGLIMRMMGNWMRCWSCYSIIRWRCSRDISWR